MAIVTNCLFPLGRAGWLIGSQVESHPWPAVRKLNSHQQNKQQKDPGSGPGVPALPEMTTSPSSPSIGHQWTICLCAGLHNSPSPYINKLTGHVSIQVCT
ncbi:hypothetical protein ACLKA7_005082 [Drosophila subpalustris]